jgi:23S rRNA maturation mini-RNase III
MTEKELRQQVNEIVKRTRNQKVVEYKKPPFLAV